MNVRDHSKQSGYTLIELLIALTIGAFLIGETFMRAADPGEKLRSLFS